MALMILTENFKDDIFLASGTNLDKLLSRNGFKINKIVNDCNLIYYFIDSPKIKNIERLKIRINREVNKNNKMEITISLLDYSPIYPIKGFYTLLK